MRLARTKLPVCTTRRRLNQTDGVATTDYATGVQRAVPESVLDSPYELRGVAEYCSGHYIARVRFTSEDDLWWRMDDYPKTPRHTAVKDNLIAEALMAM